MLNVVHVECFTLTVHVEGRIPLVYVRSIISDGDGDGIIPIPIFIPSELQSPPPPHMKQGGEAGNRANKVYSINSKCVKINTIIHF